MRQTLLYITSSNWNMKNKHTLELWYHLQLLENRYFLEMSSMGDHNKNWRLLFTRLKITFRCKRIWQLLKYILKTREPFQQTRKLICTKMKYRWYCYGVCQEYIYKENFDKLFYAKETLKRFDSSHTPPPLKYGYGMSAIYPVYPIGIFN